MLSILGKTFAFRKGRVGEALMGFGFYANVLDLGNNLGLAISTDGVGTKILVAQMMDKYDTIGIDCVAMNVNDIICVGAEPIAMTDYIAVEKDDNPHLLSEVAVGLRRGAELAHINIPGGEIAQVREMVKGLDLVGTCVGVMDSRKILRGADVEPGDAIIGFASSGIHSNGLTLAREMLLGEHTTKLSRHVAELGTTLGEELLLPTTIYVDLALRLLEETGVRALSHITSDGFLNLKRIEASVGFHIDWLPAAPPIFELIRHAGVSDEEMYLVYNMGVGFCAIVPPSDADRAISIAKSLGIGAWRIGACTDDPEKTVTIDPAKLKSVGGHFVPF